MFKLRKRKKLEKELVFSTSYNRWVVDFYKSNCELSIPLVFQELAEECSSIVGYVNRFDRWGKEWLTEQREQLEVDKYIVDEYCKYKDIATKLIRERNIKRNKEIQDEEDRKQIDLYKRAILELELDNRIKEIKKVKEWPKVSDENLERCITYAESKKIIPNKLIAKENFITYFIPKGMSTASAVMVKKGSEIIIIDDRLEDVGECMCGILVKGHSENLFVSKGNLKRCTKQI